MNPPDVQNRIGMGPISAKRKQVRIDEPQVLTTSLSASGLPVRISPATMGMDLIGWVQGHREMIEEHLLRTGGVLFRNFAMTGTDQFETLMQIISQGDLLEYSLGSTPRSRIRGKIFTSTDYPADQHIPFHNEKSYSSHWPLKIGFFCLQEAEQGGETPIVDSRKILARLDSAIVDRFERLGVMYTRYYGDLGVRWQTAFQTTDKAVVEKMCVDSGISFEWDGDNLRTRQVCPAVARHPVTGERVWFNQAHLFHISNLSPTVADSLRSLSTEQNLPRNAYYGDGSPIEPTVLEEIRRVGVAESIRFTWQAGDVLILDNMNTAHGRMPYSGLRKVVVGMGQDYSVGV